MSLVINRFKYKVLHDSPVLRLSVKSKLFFSKEAHFVFGKISDNESSESLTKLRQELPQNYKELKSRIHFDFDESVNADCYYLRTNMELPFLKKAYTKAALIEIFSAAGFIIEPFPTGADLSVFKKNSQFNNEWGIYTRYDIIILPFENEVSISIGSSDTLISSIKIEFTNDDEKLRVIDSSDGLIKRAKFNTGETSSFVIANAQRRKQLNIKNKPTRVFYQNQYREINAIYTLLLTEASTKIRFESGGFKTVHPADVDQVDFVKNQMLFGKGVSDVNAASGMRDGGPFEIPKDKSERIKFLFIYQNREQANNLFSYLKKGLKHYPGLLSYVGVSVNVANERLQYTSEQSFVQEFNSFIQDTLVNDSYSDYFALVLLPFSKESADAAENDLYYLIKEKLLEKNIASQLIDSTKINSANFHFHLPNISIAILAKIGGIPWKLERKSYNELIIGFNEENYQENSILGTAVYFDNSGKLKQVRTFHENLRSDLIIALRNSIQEYLEANSNTPPERLVIHYYKPPRREDMAKIEDLIREEFRFNLPFALVEINDTKVNTDMCFDVEFNYGMPTSGAFVRLKKGGNEYLLFNNQRYWKNPLKTINAEEYPIKVKLYNTETGGFNHKELLSQVYEFSRLYWKGLKQRSQPVTTQYAKMIAKFAAHFENGSIPSNEISQHTAWFI